MISGMELNRLRSFAAVAEAGHLTRAAERLHISQPALSAQIKALEDELDLSLFDRTPSGMALTEAGRRLLTEAEKVLAAAQALRSEARSLKGEIAGVVKLGTLSDPEFIRVGDFMGAALERYPLLKIEFQHEITGMALELGALRISAVGFSSSGMVMPDRSVAITSSAAGRLSSRASKLALAAKV